MKLRVRIFIFILSILLVSTLYIQAQNIVDTLYVKALSMTTDQHQNMYILTEKALWKYNYKMEKIYTYEYNSYGMPEIIDVHIPMKTLLFYRSFNRLQILDNRLAMVRDYDMSTLTGNFNNVICFSADNNFWVFDNNEQSLVKYNQNLTPIYTYKNMNQRLGTIVQAYTIDEANNYVILNDTSKGFYIFDMLGNFINHIAIRGVQDYQLWQDKIYFIQSEKLQSIHMLQNKTEMYSVSIPSQIKTFRLSEERLILHYPDFITIQNMN